MPFITGRAIAVAIAISIAPLIRSTTGTAAQDLESFAAHAGRRTIKTDDVMLLSRRNEGLETILKDFLEGLKVRKEKEKAQTEGKRKRRSN